MDMLVIIYENDKIEQFTLAEEYEGWKIINNLDANGHVTFPDAYDDYHYLNGRYIVRAYVRKVK